MLSESEIVELMDAATSDDRDALAEMLSEMSPEQKAFFEGYVNGYAQGVRHARQAEVEGNRKDAV